MNYKKTLTSGLIWKFSEKFFGKTISFVVSVILARLLIPENYGIVALTSIFVTFCDTFVTSGFSTALVEKSDADDLDYSSTFFSSFILSVFLYFVLFFSAPYIEKWFDTNNLCSVLRVIALRIPISAFGSVQDTYIRKNFLFKKFFLGNLMGTIVSAVIGITMAYLGFGVWALVFHELIRCIVSRIVLFITTKWLPKLEFSFNRAKNLISYGWKVLFVSLFETACAEINSLAIGKKYTSKDLAYKNKGDSIPKLIGDFINEPIKYVMLPIFSHDKSDTEKIRNIFSHCITISSFVLMPLLTGLAIVSQNLIPILFTEKWNGSIPFAQIMCFYYIFMTLATINHVLLQVKTHKHLIFTIGVNIFGIVLLLFSLNFGVIWIALSQLMVGIITYIVKSVANKKYYNYGFFQQIKDMLPSILLTMVMAVFVYSINFFNLGSWLTLVLQVLIGVFIYILGSLVLKLNSFYIIMDLLKSFIHKNS